jgi:hypothetical protein
MKAIEREQRKDPLFTQDFDFALLTCQSPKREAVRIHRGQSQLGSSVDRFGDAVQRDPRLCNILLDQEHQGHFDKRPFHLAQ